jgi:hypothetical protein
MHVSGFASTNRDPGERDLFPQKAYAERPVKRVKGTAGRLVLASNRPAG